MGNGEALWLGPEERGLEGGERSVAPPSGPHHTLPPPCFSPSYGRVYAAADPYHHTIGPAATYSIGTMVSKLAHPALGASKLRVEGYVTMGVGGAGQDL